MDHREIRKQKAESFKNAYNAQVDVEVVPSKKDLCGEDAPRKELVGPYCRVSTLSETQTESYELQKAYYESYVERHENWTLVDIYADEGISATSVRKRKDFLRLMQDCKDKKITLVITKSVSRFARNVVDAISHIRMLRNLSPPVGVYFETEHINTLRPESDAQLSLLASFAESESLNKSTNMKWAIRGRFARGIPRITNLYGFQRNGLELTPDPLESEVVRTIANWLLKDEYNIPYIVEMLYNARIPSPSGKEWWCYAEVKYILTNERYAGDVYMQKTVCVDVFSHRSVKNNGEERQYRLRGHHEPIIPPEEWQEIQRRLGTCELEDYFVGSAAQFSSIPDMDFNLIRVVQSPHRPSEVPSTSSSK